MLKSRAWSSGHLLNFFIVDIELDCHEVARSVDALDDVQWVEGRIWLHITWHVVIMHLFPANKGI